MVKDQHSSNYSAARSRAVEVFGRQDLAEDWLEKMSAELGTAPRELLDTSEGFNRVLRHLRSVELALSLR